MVELELFWNQYEPAERSFNQAEINWKKSELAAHLTAGHRVVLGLGLQYAPQWAYDYPNSRYRNQYGKAGGQLNLTFNPQLRAAVERYIARIDADLGLKNFWAIRIGAGGDVETLYPAHNADGANENAFWAYDLEAQKSSPYPGWKPGQKTYAGKPFTTAQVREWYEWYLRSLADGVNWQIRTLKQRSYAGFLQVLLPGQGVRPVDYSKAVAGYLDGSGGRMIPRGAAWDRIIAHLSDRSRVVAYVSSLADGSGGDNLCQPGDANVSLTDPQVYLWSAARWISYLADKYDLPKNGENPGRGDSSLYGAGMMRRAAAQMASCGFQGMMWAHDKNLYDGESGVTLQQYSEVIAGY